jgi:hypothetical protein
LINFSNLLENVQCHLDKEKQLNPLHRRGKKSALSLADMLMLTLFYLRHYPTFHNLGNQFGISESYSNKIFHRFSGILVKFSDLKSASELMDDDLKAVVIDVTEQPIERPKKRQKDYYSGKQKRHTIKTQLVVSLSTLIILSVFCSKGKIHDFKILKNSRMPFHEDVVKIGDSGYQGIQRLYKNTLTPIKKKKGIPLTKEEKTYNRDLAKKRIVIEHVNRRCKVFRIVKETYRGKHKNYGKIWNIVAGLVNLRYAV